MRAASLVLLALGAVSCERVPLLAPGGSTITLTAQDSALSSNGTTKLIGQVLESTGFPPHSGTHVTFTTSLGRIEPSEVSTDVSGRATALFFAAGANGTATISALSGGATTGTDGSIKIVVGSAAVGAVSLSASPATLPPTGGTSTITALVLDVNGSPLVAAPVTFTTTAGTLSATVVTSDLLGRATTTLATNQKADVSAQVGAGSSGGTGGTGGTTPAKGTTTVNVSLAPSITITPPGTITLGVPATFTFAPTVTTGGNPIRETVVSWGDGRVNSLGGQTGTVAASHIFETSGTFVVSATVTDIAGFSNTGSTTVNVLGSTTVSVVPNPTTTTVGASVEFTVTIAPPAGVTVQSASIAYGDGGSDSVTGSGKFFHTYTVGGGITRTVTVTVTDSTNQTRTASAQVRVN